MVVKRTFGIANCRRASEYLNDFGKSILGEVEMLGASGDLNEF